LHNLHVLHFFEYDAEQYLSFKHHRGC